MCETGNKIYMKVYTIANVLWKPQLFIFKTEGAPNFLKNGTFYYVKMGRCIFDHCFGDI